MSMEGLTEEERKLKKEIMVHYIYNSEAIEGSKITLEEVRRIVEEHYKEEEG